MIPYTWLFGATAGLALVGGAFMFGRSTGIDHQKAVYAKAEAKAVAAMEKGRLAIETVSSRLSEARRDQDTETREIYHEITKIIDRPVYRNQCIDSDGVRVLDKARANANRSVAGRTDDGTARDTGNSTISGAEALRGVTEIYDVCGDIRLQLLGIQAAERARQSQIERGE